MNKDLKKVIDDLSSRISKLKSREEMSNYLIGKIDGLTDVLGALEKLYASEEEEGRYGS